ncbi:hypothetical protein F4777DRAFT_280484 [Nemania sp. FL0916]|nr:hypothetical protein F4777DRAFT_280484 [Nemania sp. FL0916]
MLYPRIARASVLRATSATATASRRLPMVQQRTFLPDSITPGKTIDERYPDYPALTDAEDPDMNGGYISPPKVKRQFRDPHGDWWDKQDRRIFGEPVHQDNDTLGIFSLYEYTFVSSRMAFMQLGIFVASTLGICWAVSQVYPDKQSVPREFEGGLARELGGPGAVRARAPGDPEPYQSE